MWRPRRPAGGHSPPSRWVLTKQEPCFPARLRLGGPGHQSPPGGNAPAPLSTPHRRRCGQASSRQSPPKCKPGREQSWAPGARDPPGTGSPFGTTRSRQLPHGAERPEFRANAGRSLSRYVLSAYCAPGIARRTQRPGREGTDTCSPPCPARSPGPRGHAHGPRSARGPQCFALRPAGFFRGGQAWRIEHRALAARRSTGGACARGVSGERRAV